MSRGPTLLSGLLQAHLRHLQYANVSDLLSLWTLISEARRSPRDCSRLCGICPWLLARHQSACHPIEGCAVAQLSQREVCRDRNDPQSLESSAASSKTCTAALYCNSVLERLRCVLSVSANALLTTWPDEPVRLATTSSLIKTTGAHCQESASWTPGSPGDRREAPSITRSPSAGFF